MNQLIDVPDDPANLSTRYDMQAEASAFVKRGIDVDEACRMVGLPRRKYWGTVGGSETIKHLPTPAEIEELTTRMRAGDRVFSAGSQQRWIRENEKLDSAGTDDDRFELAGRIADDDCPVPSWLYSGQTAKPED